MERYQQTGVKLLIYYQLQIEPTKLKKPPEAFLMAFLMFGSAGKTRTYNPSVTLYLKLSFKCGLSHQLSFQKVVGRSREFYWFRFPQLLVSARSRLPKEPFQRASLRITMLNFFSEGFPEFIRFFNHSRL